MKNIKQQKMDMAVVERSIRDDKTEPHLSNTVNWILTQLLCFHDSEQIWFLMDDILLYQQPWKDT